LKDIDDSLKGPRLLLGKKLVDESWRHHGGGANNGVIGSAKKADGGEEEVRPR